MSTAAVAAICLLAGIAGLWSWYLLMRDRAMTDGLFWLLSLLEVAVVAQAVGGFVALARRSAPIEGATFGAYLVAAILVVPAAVLWGVSDKTRWGTGVLAIGCVTVVVLELRLASLWSAS